MLKLITNEVPVGLEEYYTKRDDGKFLLKVEGVVSETEYNEVKSKVKEFRDKNITLSKDIEKYQGFATIFGGDNLSPDKIQEKINSLAKEKVASITEEMKSNYETKLQELETVATQSKTKLSELVLGSEVTKVAAEHGVLSSALEDVMYRAKSKFEVVDGNLKFKDETLDAEGKPYTISTWIKDTKSSAPHLFAPSQGTGARKPLVSGVRTSDEGVTGVDRIAAAFANKTNSSKKMN